jgi:hypothetical protein
MVTSPSGGFTNQPLLKSDMIGIPQDSIIGTLSPLLISLIRMRISKVQQCQPGTIPKQLKVSLNGLSSFTPSADSIQGYW